MAEASFCIVDHLICVGVNDLLMKAIGCQMAPTTWNKTPPIPKSDASVYNRMSNLLSSMKYINGQRDIAICLSTNALVLFSVQTTAERLGAE